MKTSAIDAVRVGSHCHRDDGDMSLDPAEWSSIAAFAPLARDGMIAARVAARRLFRDAGLCGPLSLPRREGRAPCWPDGWHGSLSHCGGEGVAAIARAVNVRGVGIDIERATTLDDATLAVFARPDEAAFVGDAQDRRLRLFCAKEAAYKAFRCRSDEWRDPHDIGVAADFSHAAVRDGPAVALTRLDLVAGATVMLAVLP